MQGFATDLLKEYMDRFTSHSDLALMLSGGGARAAYQVGFLRLLAREFPDVVPGILTGVSAGGINAAYLATHQESFAVKVERLAEVWAGIRIDDVFRVDLRDLAARTAAVGRPAAGRRQISAACRRGAWWTPRRCANWSESC